MPKHYHAAMTRREAPGGEGRTQTLERTQTQRPRLWRAVLLNDEYLISD